MSAKDKKSTTTTPALVKDYMSSKLVTVDSDSSAFEIANVMREKHVSAVVIEDSGKPIGILTERDMARQVCAKDLLPSKTPATVIMSGPLITIDKNSSIESAVDSMAKNGLRHLVVMEYNDHKTEPKIIGMITTTDIARYVKDKFLNPEELRTNSIFGILYSTEEPDEEFWS
jgi:CBS domain-containing protein